MAIFVIRLLISGLILAEICEVMSVKPETFHRNWETCKRLMKGPYFDIDLVVGKPWRIYYTWNMKLDNKCLDVTFKNATPTITRRVFNDMYEYLEEQPVWDAATLHVSMGSAKHELLLFADQGAAGSFKGVPNVIRDGNILPMRKTIPLLKFFMKLLRNGKFLLMIDCHIGVASLSARPDHLPYRAEVASAAAELELGDGFPAYVIPISTMKYGFKVVNGYLGIETCSVKLCIALAPIGKRPPDEKLEETASRFGFRSEFNTSLFLNYTTRSPMPSPVEQTNDENEEDYEMENDPGDKQFIF
ncbi:hypothetical protein K1T71_011218 [Dendrolimus kikuchii]|uniref:Uncharacterized protein n=1 Tax=Dendrolimus kikuchii TaxID=765133 RepID=A0ACC1CN89_9NEOP|nr:hypothetical protein K1T71_011218 [Dendrolimus kikuchii]